MKTATGVIKNHTKQLVDQEWYHQRFDGAPMFIWAIAEAEVKREKRKPSGTEADIRACFFEDGKADWYLNMKDVRRGAEKIIRLAKRDPNISSRLLRAWRKDEQHLDRFFLKEYPAIKLSKMPLPELVDLFYKAYSLFHERATSSAIIDHFALGTDHIVSDMLRKEVFSKRKDFRESQFTEVFSIATAPVHQSFINQAEIDLLRIILKKSRQTLKDYQRKYFWSKNNYFTAQILDIKHFKEEIEAWKESGKDLGGELHRIQNTPKMNRRKKAELFRKYKLTPLLRALLKISEDFTWWQDERKRHTYFNIHMGCAILSEIGKRTGYTLHELKYAFPHEVRDLASHGVPSRKVLQIRMRGCGAVADEHATEVVTGAGLKVLKKMILGEKKRNDIHDFRGLAASTGKATGTVRIVKSATEIGKVKQGDILVAVMTRPDYVPAMKRAAAIVTNEGGITSHAAIVSRELGIPCIIGTKIATEVLKDGDRVEVNANHGVVKKL